MKFMKITYVQIFNESEVIYNRWHHVNWRGTTVVLIFVDAVNCNPVLPKHQTSLIALFFHEYFKVLVDDCNRQQYTGSAADCTWEMKINKYKAHFKNKGQLIMWASICESWKPQFRIHLKVAILGNLVLTLLGHGFMNLDGIFTIPTHFALPNYVS